MHLGVSVCFVVLHNKIKICQQMQALCHFIKNVHI